MALAALAALRVAAAPVDPFHVSASLTAVGTSWVAAVTFAVPPKHHLYADELRVTAVGGERLEPLSSTAPALIHDAFTESDREAYTGDFARAYRVAAAAVTGLTLKVEYQGCDEATCFFPQTRLFDLVPGPRASPSAPSQAGGAAPAGQVPADSWESALAAWRIGAVGVGYMRPAELLAFIDAAEGRTEPSGAAGGRWAQLREGMALFSANPVEFLRRFGVTWTVVLILLGGLLLNLTPCVLPMIPVNLAILGVGAQGSSRLRGIGLGGAYGAGIAVVYGALGLIVVLTGSQFGALNSRPGFNAAMAVVFVILALAMFDVIRIDLTRFQSGIAGASRPGSYAAAVVAGGVSALLAGACVAPVVIAVLVLAGNLYAGGAGVGLVLPFVLGLGMALPWPLAGAGLACLPKPGGWMTWVKYGFGVFILLLAFYYGAVAWKGWSGRASAPVDDSGAIRLSADAGVSAWAAPLDRARAAGKPVFVDFWATWCKNCEAMEASTFRDAAVRARLAGMTVVKCQAERPDEAVTRATLEQFGVKGLPTYVILMPGAGGGGAP